MYILIFIALSGANGISTNQVKFNSEQNCLKALNALLDMEKYSNPTIRAKCVKE
jgi:hypothetical protein